MVVVFSVNAFYLLKLFCLLYSGGDCYWRAKLTMCVRVIEAIDGTIGTYQQMSTSTTVSIL